jgi:hypothetical protein
VSLIPTNRARLTIGVGESVDVSLSPELPWPAYKSVTWSATAGYLFPPNGNTTRFTAPGYATNVALTVNYNGTLWTSNFTVVAPTGYAYALVTNADCYPTPPVNAQAGMSLRVVMAPTNVSLYRVQIMEVPAGPTNLQGYFSIYGAPPHDALHRAGQWYQLGQDNSWPGNDHASSDVYGQPWSGTGWSGGSFTWHIPVAWKVDYGPQYLLDGWDQSFTLLGDGTVTVTKFGHSVTRHASENCGTAQ